MEADKSKTVALTTQSPSQSQSQSQAQVFQGIRIENPFAFKAFQVFTGFGFGCGVGIGVGSPINLGAIPMVSQVMSATRGATDAFSGVSRHVNTALRKAGAKNIQAGVGCGVGFGHGFGIGLAVKPGVVHKVQSCVLEATMKLMQKFGMSSNSVVSQGAHPISLQSSMGMPSIQSNQNPMANVMQFATKTPEYKSPLMLGAANTGTGSMYENFASKSSSTATEASFGRTEQVLSNFLHNPMLKEDSELNDVVGHLRSENNLLQMVLKHQKVIEELMEENEKLRKILVEDLKIPPSKLESSYSSKNKSPCADCFECRRKQRRR